MSGGEQQMLAIGRALMARPKLLLLDEPSMGLAPQFIQQIFRIITEINKQGTTVLLVEQNAQQALSRAHRAYVLETGRDHQDRHRQGAARRPSDQGGLPRRRLTSGELLRPAPYASACGAGSSFSVTTIGCRRRRKGCWTRPCSPRFACRTTETEGQGAQDDRGYRGRGAVRGGAAGESGRAGGAGRGLAPDGHAGQCAGDGRGRVPMAGLHGVAGVLRPAADRGPAARRRLRRDLPAGGGGRRAEHVRAGDRAGRGGVPGGAGRAARPVAGRDRPAGGVRRLGRVDRGPGGAGARGRRNRGRRRRQPGGAARADDRRQRAALRGDLRVDRAVPRGGRALRLRGPGRRAEVRRCCS